MLFITPPRNDFYDDKISSIDNLSINKIDEDL